METGGNPGDGLRFQPGVLQLNMGDEMERLTAAKLWEEQEKTLATPKLRPGFLARILFLTMDLVYGRRGTLSKFKVPGIIARAPYQAWENIAYIAITHMHGSQEFAKRIFGRIHESRVQQDNEQCHMLILAEQIQKRGIKEGLIKFRLIPQLLALTYYYISWTLYVVKPSLSYKFNVQFENHAEHEYMKFVQEIRRFEEEPFESLFEAEVREV